MISKRVSVAKWILTMGAGLLTAGAAGAATARSEAGRSSEAPGGPGVATGTILIATGPSMAADGYLDVAPDDYGSWASITFGGAGDHFNPVGALGAMEAAFTSGFFLFVPGNQQRELLSDSPLWQNALPADASLNRQVTAPLVASDTSGDGVDDTLNSSFRVFGGATDLGFDLTQNVRVFVPGESAVIQQDYTVCNDGAQTISFNMLRAFDGDLLWDGAFESDEVGTTANGAGLGPYVFEQEPGDPDITTITLSSLQGNDYYGGKHGVQPAGGPPPYDYGTDTEVYDAFGIPMSWRNHIAGVGYDTNGLSGPAPPGSTAPQDGFIGLDFNIALAPTECTTITVFHTYGLAQPVPVSLMEFSAE